MYVKVYHGFGEGSTGPDFFRLFRHEAKARHTIQVAKKPAASRKIEA